jgi:L-fuculose-phosphate aldolase
MVLPSGFESSAGQKDVAAADARDAVRPSSNSPRADIEAFFHSPDIQALKARVCEIGRRLWERGFVDSNAGNISVKVGPDLALCTPTLISKGFMKPEDICLVGLDGAQIAGNRQRTSEILVHLGIMKQEPKAAAVVHCHSPYGTAYAIAGVAPPPGLLSEYEAAMSVAVAPYRTPGSSELCEVVARFANAHNTILMANHGVVTWSHVDVEDAYFKIEILEAYCKTVHIASQLGTPLNQLSPANIHDLLDWKHNQGIPDPRF